MKPNRIRTLVLWLIVLAVIVAVGTMIFRNVPEPEELPLDRIIAFSNDNQISKMVIDSETLYTTVESDVKIQNLYRNAQLRRLTGTWA